MKILASEYLVAENSPRKAFYRLNVIEWDYGRFEVRKESGAGQKLLDSRAWEFNDHNEAMQFFKRKIREKLNPERKSPRKYLPVAIKPDMP